MRKWCLAVMVACAVGAVQAAEPPPRNVVLVTLDGMRWQDVFRGLDARLAADEHFNHVGKPLGEQFTAATPAESARKVFPFLHEVIGKQGVLIGNRDQQSCARVTNPWFFSYPGYNEILTGKVDESINTNDAIANRNTTFLEYLNKRVPAYAGKVMAFGSWNAFPAIINAERSGVPVNIGPDAAAQDEEGRLLAELSADLPTPWPTVRYDAFTHHAALRALEQKHPRAVYIAYGETDDFAHDGRYDQYLQAAHRTDAFLRELWDFLQSDPQYRNNTVLFISTDHGRGEEPAESWQHHASKKSLAGYQKSLARYQDGIVGSDAVWMAAIGVGVPARGPIAAADCVGSNQIVATLLTLLGLEPGGFSRGIGEPIGVMLP